jgi:hypothetical protein
MDNCLDRILNDLPARDGHLAFCDVLMIDPQFESYASGCLRSTFIPETHDRGDKETPRGPKEDMHFPPWSCAATGKGSAIWSDGSGEAPTIATILGEVFSLAVGDLGCAQRKAERPKTHRISANLPRTHAAGG